MQLPKADSPHEWPCPCCAADARVWAQALRDMGLPAKVYPDDFSDAADMARVEFAVRSLPTAALLLLRHRWGCC